MTSSQTSILPDLLDAFSAGSWIGGYDWFDSSGGGGDDSGGGGDDSDDDDDSLPRLPPFLKIAYLGKLLRHPGSSLYAIGSKTPHSNSFGEVLVETIFSVGQDEFHPFKIDSEHISGTLNWFTGKVTYGVIRTIHPNLKGWLSPHGFHELSQIPVKEIETMWLLPPLRHARSSPARLEELLRGYIPTPTSSPLRKTDIREQHKKGYLIPDFR